MNVSAHLEDSPSPHSLQPGDVLSGRFRILRFIGAGGMGEVYQAEDQELGGTVALKTIRADRLERSAEFLDRFRREAKLARVVTHPNVCRIFDVGRDGDRIFFTMEFVEGQTLADLLRRAGRLTPERALPLVRQIADGLDALHHKGIVHRDLKTSNVMIAGPEGSQRAVVTDFGLAHPQEETMTMAGPGLPHIVGTPDYMSPEQLMGGTVTAAADIYAFGLVLYEMVAGKRPYAGGPALQNAVQRLASTPPPPSRHALEVPRAWDTAILQCLACDPAARPASAGAAVALLESPARAGAHFPRRGWVLAAIAALLLAAAYLAAPWRRLPGSIHAAPSSAGAHSTYLQAQDALDHYYRPHAVEDAIRLFDATVRQDPKFALAYAGLARANFQQYWQMRDAKYIEPARANAEEALSLDSNLPSVHVTLGRLYTETGQTDLAEQEIHHALQLDPRDAEAYYALAALYDKQGRTADVEPNYQKAIDLAPDDWRFPDNLADFYLRTGRLDKALAESSEAVRLTPDNPRALNNLGRIYRRMGKLDEARAAYEKALRIEPGFVPYANLGLLLDDSGKRTEAAEAYRKALALNPNNYTVWGNLGYVLNGIPGHEAESRQAFEKAIALAEGLRARQANDAELLSILGRYYAFTGNAAKSLPLVRQAAALAPDNPQVLLRAADSCEYLHRRDDALAWVSKALSHGLQLSAVNRERSLAGLRKDPRFLQLVTPYPNKSANGR